MTVVEGRQFTLDVAIDPTRRWARRRCAYRKLTHDVVTGGTLLLDEASSVSTSSTSKARGYRCR